MKDIDIEAAVQKFRKGILSEEERILVFKNITENANWSEEYDLQNDLNAAIEQVEFNKVKSLLTQHEVQKAPDFRKRALLILGLIVLLFGLGYTLSKFFHEESPKTIEDIYAQHWQPLENRIAPTTRISETTPLQEAMQIYDKGEYTSAYTSLSQLPEEYFIPEVDLYRSISLLSLRKYNEALDILTQLQLSNPLFEFERQWNIAVIEMMQGGHKESYNRLSKLLQSPSLSVHQKERTNKLLSDLEKLK